MLHVEIEPTNLCNTRCVHCPREAITRPLGKMEWSVFKTVADKALAHDAQVNFEFAGMGEPLLNPLVDRFISYVSKSSTCSLTSNGSALTPRNIERLIEAGLDDLKFSFNGTDRATYELMMGGLDFDKAVDYLQSAVELSKNKRMRVAANVSVTAVTQTRLVEIRNYLAAAGVDPIIFSKCHNRGGRLRDPRICTTPLPPAGRSRCDVFGNTLFVRLERRRPFLLSRSRRRESIG